MTLKKSFLVNMRENNKRRIWVWILSGLFWFFYFPVGMALAISHAKNYYLLQIENGVQMPLSESEALKEVVTDWLSFQEIQIIAVSLFAIICAVQGFSFLYSKKKVDLYYSVPVKKSRRFAVIYLNGVLIYLAPFLVSQLLAMTVAFINGAMSVTAFENAMLVLVMNFALFLSTYGLALIAVMLTGNLIITLMATTVFLFYELAVKGLLYYCKMEFFQFFSANGQTESTVLSPAGYYIDAAGKVFNFPLGMPSGELFAACLPAVLKNMLMAAAFLLIAYFCYKKRPSEAAGRTMAFPVTKAAVKLLIVIPAGLAAGLAVRLVVNDRTTWGNTALLIFVMTAVVVLLSAVMEVIYEMDLKAALRKKYQILLAGVGAAVLYCGFQFDLTGFDRWEPEPSDIEDAVVMMDAVVWSQIYYGSDMISVGDKKTYFLSRPGITDVEAVGELIKARGMTDEKDSYLWMDVACRMKNGRVKWRRFPVSMKEEELLNRIMDNEAFRETSYLWYDDTFFENFLNLPSKELTFDSGIRVQNLSPDDMAGLRTLYLKDWETDLYSALRNEYMCGRINFSAKNSKGNPVTFTLDIYPSYTNTIAFLKEKGVFSGTALQPEDIESITVTNRNSEVWEQELYYSEARYGNAVSVDRYQVTKTYTDPEQIEALTQAMYSERFRSNWASQKINYDYNVTVRFKSGAADSGESSSDYYRGSTSFYLIADRIPEFVERETSY